jgi:hypothetical protein
MDDFKARLAKFGSDAKAASASVKDLESFKKAFSVTSARMIAAAATKNTASSRADTF